MLYYILISVVLIIAGYTGLFFAIKRIVTLKKAVKGYEKLQKVSEKYDALVDADYNRVVSDWNDKKNK
jgi:hypothetical protein